MYDNTTPLRPAEILPVLVEAERCMASRQDNLRTSHGHVVVYCGAWQAELQLWPCTRRPVLLNKPTYACHCLVCQALCVSGTVLAHAPAQACLILQCLNVCKSEGRHVRGQPPPSILVIASRPDGAAASPRTRLGVHFAAEFMTPRRKFRYK